MTQNQIAYQQNLIRAEEAAIKDRQQKAEERIKSDALLHQKLMDISNHLHEYGYIRQAGPGAYETVNSTRNLGLKAQQSAASASKSYSEVFKNLFGVGKMLGL